LSQTWFGDFPLSRSIAVELPGDIAANRFAIRTPIMPRKDVDRRDKPWDKPGDDDGEVVRSERDTQ
jgi:hypothetical protein